MNQRAPLHPRARSGGFTLIELMITIAIVALLASIAIPSYSSFIARGKRADARGQLLQAAQYMQRFYAANDAFNTSRSGQAIADSMPTPLQRAPAEGVQVYTLSINATSAAYTLTMAPSGTMASDPCASFILNSAGVRSVSGAATKTRDECWK
jgi:type IV pilus assembly protein PilE